MITNRGGFKSFLLITLGVLTTLSSCSNLDIVKRRYRSGYHIQKKGKAEISKSKDSYRKKNELVSAMAETKEEIAQPLMEQLEAQTDQVSASYPNLATAQQSEQPTIMDMEVSIQVFQQALFDSREKELSREFTRAIGIEPEEEIQSWNPYGFVGLGFGTLALVMVIIGGVHLMRYNPPPGSGFYFLGAGFGIALAVTLGIIGLKKKSIRNKKGRGFAFASWGSGALAGLAIILVGLMYVIWQLTRAF